MNIKTEGMEKITHETDLCVIGGGLTGLCAALAAAREGIRVVLMQDRPVLGGNASSEIRMWVRGAYGLHNREMGIISELEEENIYINPELTCSVWDSVMWSKVKEEKNIELLLNCSCCDAVSEKDADGVERIKSVVGWQLTTYTWHTVKARYFADCSGDSVLATLCGARFRVGREADSEYGETMGRKTADRKTMGNSILMQAAERNRPIKFTPPAWAYRFETDADFNRQGENVEVVGAHGSLANVKINRVVSHTRAHRVGTDEGNFWWIEVGGEQDSLHDAEEIRDDLIKIAYGIWDHIKNHGDHGAANWELEWVGALPGKRESRRYVGAHVLTQKDVEAGGKFEDIIAYGGWPMDDHNTAGFYSFKRDEPPSKLYPAPSPYGIPYRVLYGHEVENLFFAGRNISATHAAISSTRVMATCALLGQALGTAAAVCVNDGVIPDEVYTDKAELKKLQTHLQEAGCTLPGFTREIPALTKRAVLNLSDEEKALLQNGVERPDENMCVSYATLPVGGSLTFTFENEEEVQGLRLVFDPDFSRESVSKYSRLRIFAQRGGKGFDFEPLKVPKTLVKSFAVFADGKEVFRDDENHVWLRRIPLACRAKVIEVKFFSTWGEDAVHVFSADVN